MSDKPRVLCVDDEQALLDGLRLQLRKKYDVVVAASGAEGIAAFDAAMVDPDQRRFGAVVSDMRMPNMPGDQFLAAIMKRSPETPRILLSGQADLDSTISAINEARIFRFLTKPCPVSLLCDTIDEALELARLREAERVLLDETLRGSVGMLTDLLGLVNAGAYATTMRVADTVRALLIGLGRAADWDIDLAALLSQIGRVVIDDDAMVAGGAQRHVLLAADLVAGIPRLDTVGEMIRRSHESRPCTSDPSLDHWSDHEVKCEVLRVAVEFDRRLSLGASGSDAIKGMRDVGTPAPAVVLDALAAIPPSTDSMVEAQVALDGLMPGMMLGADLCSASGSKLVSEGTVLTSVLIQRIGSFAERMSIPEPVTVMAPMRMMPKVNVASA